METTLDRRNTLPIKAPAGNDLDNGLLLEPEDLVDESPAADGKAAVSQINGKRRLRLLAGAGLVIGGLALGWYYERFIAPYESTDDAFIEGHVAAIAPQVAGRVLEVVARDNQEVRQGDVLVKIDPRDYQAKLDQARANLTGARSRQEQAKAQLAVDEAKAGQEQAGVTAAEAEASRAQADLKRYEAVESRAVSRSQMDLAETQARSSSAQVEVARNKALAAEAQAGLSRANIATAIADVQQAEATARQAELDLSYTQITAPADGFVTRRTAEAGAYVQPGQALLAIVPREVWVVANFKETQLTHMRPGQTVQIKVDAYPQTTFQGRVDSIQAGSGARFSLMPPENASGNYVKVVQRVPVKIVLDEAAGSRHLLGPGMSVTPRVRVN
jgi:membrane fusion protein (multidrug efflux system)